MGQLATDIIQRVDSYTKELITYKEVTEYEESTDLRFFKLNFGISSFTIEPSNEKTFIDGYIYIKYNGKYYKRVIENDIYNIEMFFNPNTDIKSSGEVYWDLPMKRLDNYAKGRTVKVQTLLEEYHFEDTINIYSPLQIEGFKAMQFEGGTKFLIHRFDRNGLVFNESNSYYGHVFLPNSVRPYNSAGYSIKNITVRAHITAERMRGRLSEYNEDNNTILMSRMTYDFREGMEIFSGKQRRFMSDGTAQPLFKATLGSQVDVDGLMKVVDGEFTEIGDVIKGTDNPSNGTYPEYVKVVSKFPKSNVFGVKRLSSSELSTLGVTNQNTHSSLQIPQNSIAENLTQNNTFKVEKMNFSSNVQIFNVENVYSEINQDEETNIPLARYDRRGSGIVPLTRGEMEKVAVSKFGGNGFLYVTDIHMDSDADLSLIEVDPIYQSDGYTPKPNSRKNCNINCGIAKQISSVDNGHHGILIAGGDSNAIDFYHINCTHNGGYGIWDNSFLGCHIYGGHISICLCGAHNLTSKRGVAVGLYTEGRPYNDLLSFNQGRTSATYPIIGGTQGSGLHDSNDGWTGVSRFNAGGFSVGDALSIKTSAYGVPSYNSGVALKGGNKHALTIVGSDNSYGGSFNELMGSSISFVPKMKSLKNFDKYLYKASRGYLALSETSKNDNYTGRKTSNSFMIGLSDFASNVGNFAEEHIDPSNSVKTGIFRGYIPIISDGKIVDVISKGKNINDFDRKDVYITGRGIYEGFRGKLKYDHTGLITGTEVLSDANDTNLSDHTPTELIEIANTGIFPKREGLNIGHSDYKWDTVYSKKSNIYSSINPNGNLEGKLGDMCTTYENGEGVLWFKSTNSGTTGWKEMARTI